MSYAKIASIKSENGTLSYEIQLFEKGGTEADAFFPVTKQRLTFSLSENGFGLLNQNLTIRLLDDASDTYYNRFNNIDNAKFAVRVLVSKSGMYTDSQIFWGFTEKQLITKKEFENNKKELTVRFYTPLQFKTRARYYSSDIQTALVTGQGSVVASQIVRMGQLFNQVMFSDYFEDTYEWSSRLRPQTSRGSGWPVPNAFPNALYFRRSVAFGLDQDITVTDWFILILRSFFARAGYSFYAQMPSIHSVHNGRLNGERNSAVINNDLVDVNGGELIVNGVTLTNDIPLPVLQQSKILKGATRKDIAPYFSVQYTREGETDPDPFLPNNNVVRREVNPNNLNPLLYEDYQGVNIPFDPYETSLSANTMLNVGRIASGSAFLSRLSNTIDPDYDTIIAQDLTYYNARSHMDMMENVGFNNNFTYTELLDPMVNHLTDWNNKAICILRGEYDLVSHHTIITESSTPF